MSTRGPLKCVSGKCICNAGYCADINKVFNTCRVHVGTCPCKYGGQKTKEGAAVNECYNGVCLCYAGYILDESVPNEKMCKNGASGLGSLVSSGLNAYGQVKDAVGAIGKAGSAALKGDFSGALAAGKDAVGKVTKAVGGVTTAYGHAKDAAMRGYAEVKGVIGTVSKAVKDMDLQGTWNTIKKTGGHVWGAAKGIAKAGGSVMGCVSGEVSCTDAWGHVQDAYKGVTNAVGSVKETYGHVKGKAMIGYNAAQGLHNKYLVGGYMGRGGGGGGGRGGGGGGKALMGRFGSALKKKYGSRLANRKPKRAGGGKALWSKFTGAFKTKYASRLKRKPAGRKPKKLRRGSRGAGGNALMSKLRAGFQKSRFKGTYNKKKSFYKHSRGRGR